MNNTKKIKIITFSVIGVVLILCAGFLLGYFLIKKPDNNKYSVSFYVDDSLYSKSYTELGENAVFPKDPIKAGYDFVGWYNGDILVTEVCETSKTDIPLNARWQINAESTYFSFDSSDGYKITGLKSEYETVDSIIIPDYVTSIEDFAFLTNEYLVSVEFDKNSKCEYIGQYAFEGCENLKQINIPSTVKQIGDLAFYVCYELQSINFEGNSMLESIGNGAFADCTSLTTIHIPGNIKEFGYGVFSGCSSLENIIFDENCSFTSLGDSTFDLCSSLKFVVIPASVNNIGFTHSFSLSEIYYYGTENDFDSITGKEYILSTDPTVYFYSQSKPVQSGNFWHLLNNAIVKW